MPRTKSTYFWVAFLFLLLLLWSHRDEIGFRLRSRPMAESLDFSHAGDPTAAGLANLSPDEKNNTEVFERVSPAVVNIATTTLGMNFWLEIIPREGQGSGFIIDGEGYVLTNNHVVAKARKITVTMADGSKVQATLVGRDPFSDLAVIKIPAAHVQVVAELGDSDRLRVGQKAIAIGNPFGLSHTLTTGIISALNRGVLTEQGRQIEDLIQTDTAINPGNSGGPLLNSAGQVIGINTAIYSLSGGYQGIGFAIPINRAKQVASQLITLGRVTRPWLGISGLSLSPGLSANLNLGVSRGVMIVEVLRGSPAHRSGLKGAQRDVMVGSFRIPLGGDIITAMDGREIHDMKQLVSLLDTLKVGQSVRLRIFREGTFREVDVRLTERP